MDDNRRINLELPIDIDKILSGGTGHGDIPSSMVRTGASSIGSKLRELVRDMLDTPSPSGESDRPKLGEAEPKLRLKWN